VDRVGQCFIQTLKHWGGIKTTGGRDAEGVEEGEAWGGGVPLPSRLGGLGERCELPQWGPVENEFGAL